MSLSPAVGRIIYSIWHQQSLPCKPLDHLSLFSTHCQVEAWTPVPDLHVTSVQHCHDACRLGDELARDIIIKAEGVVVYLQLGVKVFAFPPANPKLPVPPIPVRAVLVQPLHPHRLPHLHMQHSPLHHAQTVSVTSLVTQRYGRRSEAPTLSPLRLAAAHTLVLWPK